MTEDDRPTDLLEERVQIRLRRSHGEMGDKHRRVLAVTDKRDKPISARLIAGRSRDSQMDSPKKGSGLDNSFGCEAVRPRGVSARADRCEFS